MTSTTGVPPKSAALRVPQNDRSTRRDSLRYALGNFFFGFASRRNEKPRMKRKDDSGQLQSAPPARLHESFTLPGWNRRYVVSPFRTKRASLDLARSPPREIIGDGTDGGSLTNIEESAVEDGSAKAEDSKNRDSRSKATVRWRITIRHRCANSKSISSQV